VLVYSLLYSTVFPKLHHKNQNSGPGNTLDFSVCP